VEYLWAGLFLASPQCIQKVQKMEQGTATLLIDKSHTITEVPPKMIVASGQKISQALSAGGVIFRQPVIVLVNGQTNDVSYILQPGDVVRFFPQISGGSS